MTRTRGIAFRAMKGFNTAVLGRAMPAAVSVVAMCVAAVLGVAAPAAVAAEEQRLGRWTSPFWEGGAEAFDPPSAERSKRFPTAATAVVLPDGRLLYWNGLENSEEGDLWVGSADGTIIVENARVRLLDLRALRPRWTRPLLERGTTDDPETGRATHDLFCSDQKLLYTGKVLVAGGSRWDVPDDTRFPEPRGVKATSVFDPADNAFRPVADMREPRWYPSLVTLADGRVSVHSGVRRVLATFMSPGASLSQVRLTEIFEPRDETWVDGGTSRWSFPLYPRLHLLPDGKVFYGGAGQSWNPGGETADQVTWSERRLYDPAARRWESIGQARSGTRSGAASVMLRLEPPYDHADILMAGGTLGASPGTWMANTLSEIVRWTPKGVIDVGPPKGAFDGLAGDRSQLRQPRWFGTPVLLPTGEVLLVNGGDADDVVDPGSAAAVRRPEIYDPATGTWRAVAASARDRVYHSTAALLPDGRVLVGGNAPHPAHYLVHDNTTTRSNNFRDSTFEIFEPPYLFRGPRPVIQRVDPARKGRALRVGFGSRRSAARVSEIVLVRLGAGTHAMDGDLRSVKLGHATQGRSVVARLPRGGDGRLLPPGPYHLFALRESAKGPVPSVARTVLIKPAGDGRVVARRVRPGMRV